MPEAAPGTQDLTKDKLNTDAAVLILGALAAGALQDRGMVTFYVAADGSIYLAPPSATELDLIPEREAIQLLLLRGHSEAEVEAYLRGRDARRGK